MTSPDPMQPTEFVAYLMQRDRERTARVEATLNAMTVRERRLVREAAVMGYVRGAGYGAAFGRDRRVPNDSAIMFEVLSCIHSMPDLNPVTNHLTGH